MVRLRSMRFEFIAGSLCLDFANTIHDLHDEDRGEELRGISDLLDWAREARLLSSAERDRLVAHYNRSPRDAATALLKATSARDLLLSIFAAIANARPVSSQRLSELNSALAHAPGLLHVYRDADRIMTEWKSAAAELDGVLFNVLKSAAELLASDRLDRIRQCAATHCTWLFVDGSRNRGRRWCDMSTCGNRMKARRHYRRLKAAR